MDLNGRKVNSRAYCSWYNFKSGDQQKKVGVLSGAARMRALSTRLNAAGSSSTGDAPYACGSRSRLLQATCCITHDDGRLRDDGRLHDDGRLRDACQRILTALLSSCLAEADGQGRLLAADCLVCWHRWRAQPVAAGVRAEAERQPAAAGRAHQRPGCEHAAVRGGRVAGCIGSAGGGCRAQHCVKAASVMRGRGAHGAGCGDAAGCGCDVEGWHSSLRRSTV